MKGQAFYSDHKKDCVFYRSFLLKSDENWGGEGCWLNYRSTTWEWYRFRFILGVPSTSPWNLFVSLLWVHWRSTCCWCAWTLRNGSECRHCFSCWSRKSAHSWPVSSPASPHHVHRVWLKHLCRNLFCIYWSHKKTLKEICWRLRPGAGAITDFVIILFFQFQARTHWLFKWF